jgi:hypothetical protein
MQKALMTVLYTGILLKFRPVCRYGIFFVVISFKTHIMKTIFTLCFTGTLLLTNVAKAQQFGLTSDVVIGQGEGLNSASLPLHGGFSYGFLYSPKRSPFSFGYRNAMNIYSSTMRKELPFYREDYVHSVANISNTNMISQHILFTRIEINKNGGFSPFIEIGGGYAKYKSKWSATDPYESNNNDCEGYVDQGTFFKSGTFMANASAGVNIKFNKLSNRDNCTGIWLTMAVDYTRGGMVSYLNSKTNALHFYYDQGTPILTGNPRSPVSTHDHGGNSVAPGGCYSPYSPYYERHELIQLRIGLTMVIGNCK